MDKYKEHDEARTEYFYREMMLMKSNALIKIKHHLKEESFLEKLAELIINAKCEDMDGALEISKILDMSDLEEIAILEDLACFSREFIDQRANTYAGDNYEQ